MSLRHSIHLAICTANLRAQGQRSAQFASIQAALTSRIAATAGAATTQRLIIQAAAGFQKSQVNADVDRSIRETNYGQADVKETEPSS